MPEHDSTPATWISFMRSGNFESAWKFSDEVLKSGINRNYNSLPRHYQCIWDGTPLNDKTVLVRCYHGLGDTIMFVRYIPMLKAIAKKVIVWAQPRLIELLGTMSAIDELLPLHEGIPDVQYDTDIEIMELPHFFRSSVFNIPRDMPYLHVSPLPLSPANDQLSVGLVWSAGNWDQSRTVPFSQLAPLTFIKGAKFYILQDDPVRAGWKEGSGINPGMMSLYEHARIISWLDLLITVDSMPAHLAGALNTPVWVMLNAEADWRWMENRADSPWYPSMRLFRQEEKGDWKPVIEKISTELHALALLRS